MVQYTGSSIMEEKVVRKRTTRKVAKKTVSRKAPTRATSVSNTGSEKNNVALYVSIVVFLLFVGVSVVVGYSDKGEINIDATITNIEQNGTPEEREQLKNIPAQKAKSKGRNGGLIPTTDTDKSAVPTPESTEENASSTESTASSTEEIAEGEESTSEDSEPANDEGITDETPEEITEPEA